jgi:signal transduction histidine kinase
VSAALAVAGWLAAVALAVVVAALRRRLELVARAEHELRGPLTAFSLALDSARGTPSGRRLGVVLEAELARARAGLADLAAARTGRRQPALREPVAVERLVRSSAAAWEPAARRRGSRVRVRSSAGLVVVRGDRDRLAQALGNVMANAVEHGEGDVSVSTSRTSDGVRIEVTNETRAGAAARGDAGDAGRGRGLAIAADAAADAGASLSAAVGSRHASAVLEIPIGGR